MSSSLLISFLLGACTPPCAEGYGRDTDGNCAPLRAPPGTGTTVPDDTATDTATDTGTDTATDTGTRPPLELELGDPIERTGGESSHDAPPTYEYVDAVIVDDDHAVLCGEGGTSLVSLADGSRVWSEHQIRYYDVAWDETTDLLYAGTREYDVDAYDLSDRTNPVGTARLRAWSGFHEDLAADSGHLLVAALADGAVLLDGQSGEKLTTIEASWAAAVGLSGDRAVVGDGAEIILYDISTVTSPQELSRVSVRATARNITFDGDHIGVALGGHGVAVIRVVEDELSLRAQSDLPGSVYGLDLDGSYLWASAWSEIALIWLGDGGPVIVGAEPVSEATMGIAGTGGRAVAADWLSTSSFQRIDGVAGPEVSTSEIAWADREDPPGASVDFTNLGAMDLELGFTIQPSDIELDVETLLLEPGEDGRVVVTGQTGQFLDAELRFTSNDPDEPEGTVRVREAQQSIGQLHEPLSLEGYVPPSTNLEPYDLANQTGRVTVLAYFALY